jgi:hypothetical protein
MKKSFSVLLPVSLVAIAGCNTVSQGFVAREWTDNMRELGIYPMFPPRADIRVGDVFVNLVEASDSAALNENPNTTPAFPQRKRLGVHFASIDVTQLLEAQYSSRTVFAAAPETPASAPAIAANASSGLKLKTVAFPIFLKATATGADIEGLIPVDGLPIKGGLGANSVKSASVTITGASSYSVPWKDIYRTISGAKGSFFQSDSTNPGESTLNADVAAALKTIAISSNGEKKGAVDVTFVNEVYFARSFDVTFSLTSDAAIAVSKSLATSKTLETATAPALSASSPVAVAPIAGASAAQGQNAPAAETLAAAEELKRLKLYSDVISQVPSVPGATIGASVSSSGTIGLRTLYAEPIAVGYRGVTIRVNLTDGTWVGGNQAGNPGSNETFSKKTNELGVTNESPEKK